MTLPISAQYRLLVNRAGTTRHAARSRSETTYTPAARLYLLREIIVISNTALISVKRRYSPMMGTYGAIAGLLTSPAIHDGFSIIALNWLESFGWCGRGEASAFLCDNWDNKNERARLGARGVPLNPHGGSLSEGGTQGSGHLRESVVQLRGQAGARQVPDAKAAVVAIGGLYMNAQGVVLRR